MSSSLVILIVSLAFAVFVAPLAAISRNLVRTYETNHLLEERRKSHREGTLDAITEVLSTKVAYKVQTIVLYLAILVALAVAAKSAYSLVVN